MEAKSYVDLNININSKVMIFIASQFCFYDPLKRKWNIGDVFDGDQQIIPDVFAESRSTVDIPDNCSIRPRLNDVNKNLFAPIIITGGNFGSEIVKTTMGLSLKQTEVNGLMTLEALTTRLADMPVARYLHQSAGIHIDKKSFMVVMGGKSGIFEREALKSVFKLEISEKGKDSA